ncbi:NtaA/DmoA family FMN-dependent monooxygenase [Herbiconiux sp. 11R-BC]|uniref:NtaA/DmoA family FMN-dependent monooxygenase n=1 Tax=Herbiconiux sp. 11R-BC TaxID=3111637 RepID=UPI003BFC8425
MTRTRRHLLLAVNLQGFGQRPAAWQVQDVAATELLDDRFYGRLGAVAERGHLDAVFFADHPSFSDPNPRPLGLAEPFVAAAAIAGATDRLGVVVSASTTYNDPVELADRVLGLDLVSGGRAGWNVVTTYDPAVSGNFGLSENPDRSARYRRAGEFVDLVDAHWRSALTGEPYRHAGEFFAAEGASDAPASPQGRPFVFQAGGSPQGRDLAARVADGVFSVELTASGALRHAEEVRQAAGRFGRAAHDVAILPGLSLVLGSTEHEARRLYDDLEARVPEPSGLGALSGVLGADARLLDLDAPIPAELLQPLSATTSHTSSLGYRETFLDWVAGRNTTVREVLRDFGGYGSRIVIGTPQQVADDIEQWFDGGLADGFNLMLDRFPAGLELFVDEVVPLLQAKGIARTHPGERTLRGRVSGPATRPFS